MYTITENQLNRLKNHLHWYDGDSLLKDIARQVVADVEDQSPVRLIEAKNLLKQWVLHQNLASHKVSDCFDIEELVKDTQLLLNQMES